MTDIMPHVPRRSFDPRHLIDPKQICPSLFDKRTCLVCAYWRETGGTCPERKESPCRRLEVMLE